VSVAELEGGTLTSSVVGFGLVPSTALLSGRAWNGIGWSSGIVGTLLGPEGTGRPCRWKAGVGLGTL
jgi:hypothetical protein